MRPPTRFSSRTTSDAAVARVVCEALEEASIQCCIVRDIAPGTTWAGAIVDGIDRCKVFAVVFSARANESREVLREVERASRQHKPLLPVRVEDIAPTGDISYFLSAMQWLDAFPPPVARRMVDVVNAARALLMLPLPAPSEPAVAEPDFVEVDLDDFGRRGGRPSRFLIACSTGDDDIRSSARARRGAGSRSRPAAPSRVALP